MKDGSNVLTVTSAGDSKDSAFLCSEKTHSNYSFDYVAQLGKRVMYEPDLSVEAVLSRLSNYCGNPKEILELLLQYQLVEFEEEPVKSLVEQPTVSYFKKPIVRPKGEPIRPYKNVTLLQVWQIIVGGYLKKVTTEALHLYAEFQRTGNKKPYERKKRYECDFVTFCATFFTKENNGVNAYAGLLALDFDKLTTDERLRLWNDLPQDIYFETALMYNTPGGIRWVIEMDNHPTPGEFKKLQDYCLRTYAKADDTGDVSRASFLFHSPTAYLNPKYEG
jgi:hypothetical protein